MFHSTSEAKQNLDVNVLLDQITALTRRIETLERNYPRPVGNINGVGFTTGFIHNYHITHNWGVAPFDIWPLSVRGAPYQTKRFFTVEELYHAFRTWGDYHYAPRTTP